MPIGTAITTDSRKAPQTLATLIAMSSRKLRSTSMLHSAATTCHGSGRKRCCTSSNSDSTDHSARKPMNAQNPSSAELRPVPLPR